MRATAVGYTRLMQADEDGTLSRLKHLRQEFIEPLVAEHRGRIVKLMGDGILCVFGGAVDAIACAAAIQRGMAEREAGVPAQLRLRLRIGVNLGDIVHEADGDIYGDGVNLVARLEGLAEPGGICVSQPVQQQQGAGSTSRSSRWARTRSRTSPTPSSCAGRTDRRRRGS